MWQIHIGLVDPLEGLAAFANMCSSSDLLGHFSALLCIPSPGHFGFNYFLYKWTCIFLKIRSRITIWRQSKNIRVAVVHTGSRLIAVRILRGIGASNIIDSENILIPRISFQTTLHLAGHPSQTVPFKYATTFNSCQGLTLDSISIDLTHPIFLHGQLYTALSRIRHRTHTCIRLHSGETTTTNVTYGELLI